MFLKGAFKVLKHVRQFFNFCLIVGDMDRSPTILAAELKNQRKLVKNLKKKSLWSKNMEEVAISHAYFQENMFPLTVYRLTTCSRHYL